MELVPGMTDFNTNESHHTMKSSDEKSEVRLMSLVQSITGVGDTKLSAPKQPKSSKDIANEKSHYTQTRSERVSMASFSLDSLVTDYQNQYDDGPN